MSRTIKTNLEVPEEWLETITTALAKVDDQFAADLGKGTAGNLDRLVTFILRDALRDEKSRNTTMDAYAKALEKMATVQRDYGIVMVHPTFPAKKPEAANGKKRDSKAAPIH